MDFSGVWGSTVLNLIGGLANAGLTFGFTLLVSRSLGAGESGVLFEAIAVFSILIVVGQFGAGAVIVKAISSVIAVGRSVDIPRVVGVTAVPVLVFSTAIGLALTLSAPELAPLIVKTGDRARAVVDLRWFGIFVPIASVSAVALAATRAFGTMVPTFVIENVGKPLFRFLAACVLVATGLGAGMVGQLWVAAVGVAAVPVVVCLWRLTRCRMQAESSCESPAPLGPTARAFWKLTLPQWSAEVFQLGVLWVDVLMVGALSSARDAGVYAAVSRLILVGSLGLAAVVLAVGPTFGRLIARGELERAGSLYRDATALLIAAAFPVYFTGAVFAPLLVQIFGSEFRSGHVAFSILAGAMFLNVAAGPGAVALLMAGRTNLIMLDSGVGLILNMSLNAVLIPTVGIDGAAMAWASSILATNALLLIQLRGTLHTWPVRRGVFVACGIPCVPLVASCAIALSLFGETLLAFIAGAGVGLGAYTVMMWRTRAQLGLHRDVFASADAAHGSFSPDRALELARSG